MRCGQYLFLDGNSLHLAILRGDKAEVGEGRIPEEDIEVHSDTLETQHVISETRSEGHSKK